MRMLPVSTIILWRMPLSTLPGSVSSGLVSAAKFLEPLRGKKNESEMKAVKITFGIGGFVIVISILDGET
jgi:hypothetical protein